MNIARIILKVTVAILSLSGSVLALSIAYWFARGAGLIL